MLSISSGNIPITEKFSKNYVSFPNSLKLKNNSDSICLLRLENRM